MNKRGFYSFLLVLAYGVLLLSVITAEEKSIQSLRETKAMLIEGERINLERTIVEENVDFIIKETLREELQKTNNAEAVKERINEKLFLLLLQIQKNAPNTRFFKNNGEELDRESLEKITKALVVDIKEKTRHGEYYITGGWSTGETIIGKISGKHFEQEFLLPVGYTVMEEIEK